MAQKTRLDDRVVAYGQWVIRWRWPVLIGTVLVAFLAIAGARLIEMKTEYRIFFGPDNSHLQAFDRVQNIYTKNDNILFVLAPQDGAVFTRETLSSVEGLVREAWKIPFAIRVDAVTNFQHTRGEGDDLVVADLVEGAEGFSESDLERAKRIALSEPLLRNRLIPPESHVTGVNVTLQMPEKAADETFRAVAAARDLAERVKADYPDLEIYLTGNAMLNNAFQESSLKDMQTLIPVMYLAIFLVMGLLLRSVTGTLATGVVIALSAGTGMGLAGWLGLPLTPPSSAAPTIIMTLAVADSIHVLVTMFQQMRGGMRKEAAIVESLRVNMQPVFLTSLTTAIGFLSMNFSDVPPFNDLGNMTAMGVTAAFVYSVTMLPALMAVLPVRVRSGRDSVSMDRLAEWVIGRRRPLLWGSAVSVLALAAFLPTNELNDQFVDYFDKSVAFRRDTDFAVANLSGIYQIDYSLESGESGGISDPAYLERLEAFKAWFLDQPGVIHVNALSETMKRLNKNMHGDDPAFDRLPNRRDLAAQYLLLYEMSLPYGLDLNNQINVDKSATRFTVTVANKTSKELRGLVEQGEQWLQDHAPSAMFSHGVGTAVMFSYISDRNIKSMLIGTALAFLIISGVLVVALKSFRFGVLSLVPNLVPAVLAFGLWGILVGQVNLGLSVVVGMTLGIVVDDTVHFLSKYLRARREQGLGAEGAVRYAFSSVGTAMVVTSLILVVGFGVLAQSVFDFNASMGKMTAITIVFALVADFLMLPPLLMALSRKAREANVEEGAFAAD